MVTEKGTRLEVVRSGARELGKAPTKKANRKHKEIVSRHYEVSTEHNLSRQLVEDGSEGLRQTK